MKYVHRPFLVTSLSLVVFVLHGISGEKPSPRSINQVGGVTWAKKVQQGFDMKLWLSNQLAMGIAAWNPLNVPVQGCGVGIGLLYPITDCIEHLYGAAPIIGAKVNGVRRVSVGYNPEDASMDFVPFRQNTSRDRIWQTSLNKPGEPNKKGFDDDGDGKIDEDELDGLDNDGDWNPLTDDVGADGLPDSLEHSCDGQAYDPVTNPDPAGDNYEPSNFDKCHPDPNTGALPRKNNKDVYTEKNGIPDHWEPHVDEDYGAISDNDFGLGVTDTAITGVSLGHVPIGAKIWEKSYAWSLQAGSAIVVMDYSFVDVWHNSWQDVYIAMLCDFDVGPVNIPTYYTHNYAGYDSATHTAYMVNPVDRGSTPVGVTLLGQTKPLDSLKFIFQWFNAGDLGTKDSLIYDAVSSESFSGQLIRPDQNQSALADSRMFISIGPYQLQHGDTAKTTYAFISGSTVDEMLSNSRRAHRLYNSGYFIMPTISIIDSGGSSPIKISWNAVPKSPYGSVTSYRLYYGTAPGVYTDSVSTTNLSATISGLTPRQLYYFAVLAVDDHGNYGALSDEISNVPLRVSGVSAIGLEKSISILWNSNPDADIAGYNIYRHSSVDTIPIKLTTTVPTDNAYSDMAVWGDRTYYYSISAVDKDGHEGPRSYDVSSHLIPPATPAQFFLIPKSNTITLSWLPNTEGDIAGYNIYRADSLTGFVKRNSSVLPATKYIDSTIAPNQTYKYYIEAVDSTGAVSAATAVISGKNALMDMGIFVMNSIGFANPFSVSGFFDQLLLGHLHTVLFSSPDPSNPSSVNILSQYSTVLWNSDLVMCQIGSYPIALKGYLLGGGRLLIAGRGVAECPGWFNFLKEFFGLDSLSPRSNLATFDGAYGSQGFPAVTIDSMKMKSVYPYVGRMQGVEQFPTAPAARTIYTYRSDPFDSLAEGKPVGLRAIDSTIKAYYLSFSPYYLDTASASALMTRVLSDFNEVTDVRASESHVPTSFRLYDAYPNPFNPTTELSFVISNSSWVILKIYDVLGREVATLVNEVKEPGIYNVTWDASSMPSGVYFYRLHANGKSTRTTFSDVKKVLLVK